MKARIKGTNEVLEIFDIGVLRGERVIGFPINDIELVNETQMAELSTTEPDWNQIKIQAAIAAMQGYLSSSEASTYEMLAEKSVRCADSLITELKKQQQ